MDGHHLTRQLARLWLSHWECRACWTRGWTQPALGVPVVSRKRAGRCVRGDHTAHCEAARASEHLASVAVDLRRAVRGTGVTPASARRREVARRRRPPPAQSYGLDRSAQPGAAASAGCGSRGAIWHRADACCSSIPSVISVLAETTAPGEAESAARGDQRATRRLRRRAPGAELLPSDLDLRRISSRCSLLRKKGLCNRNIPGIHTQYDR
jgi:hypothetical protein